MLLDPEAKLNKPFSLQSLLEHEPMGSWMLDALANAGLEPEMWLPEFGSQQWEVTVAPADALVAADRAIHLREIVRNTARAMGFESTLAPIVEANGGGNGVHVHYSLRNKNDEYVTFDPTKPGRVSDLAGAFTAGVLAHGPAISAMVASNVVSYERLAPNRWSVGGVFLGENNREALVRICPLFDIPGAKFEKQYNLEFRGADATSNPWLVLGLIVRAGIEGLRQNLPTPKVIDADLSELSESEADNLNVTRLPTSLDEALEALTADETVCSWLPPRLLETFLIVKRAEIKYIDSVSDDERYRLYATAY